MHQQKVKSLKNFRDFIQLWCSPFEEKIYKLPQLFSHQLFHNSPTVETSVIVFSIMLFQALRFNKYLEELKVNMALAMSASKEIWNLISGIGFLNAKQDFKNIRLLKVTNGRFPNTRVVDSIGISIRQLKHNLQLQKAVILHFIIILALILDQQSLNDLTKAMHYGSFSLLFVQ